ncbi:hypothetical protein [Paraglaciecola sp. L3A3]|uniref:hypothetical protein n=1 Tax=Paraglaciecola sp. L3A3 TaxID=2686358 RepID=UPI00131DE6FB|nr:hypothetical protein [Paraglaciecola sp. L3A3]
MIKLYIIVLIISFTVTIESKAFETLDKFKTAPQKSLNISASSNFLSEPVKGVSLFYLNGRDQEDLPQLIEKLYHGENACKGTTIGVEKRFINTLNELKQSGVNWVRLLIGKGFYEIYKNRCDFDLQQIYPKMSKTHIEAINHFLAFLTRPEFNFNIEIVLGGSKNFADAEHDIEFFDSILSQINKTNINMVMLGGDVQPSRVTYHAKWIKRIFHFFDNHPDPALKHLNYSFDTVTYRNSEDLKSYLDWVKQNIPTASVVTLNLYVHLPKGEVKNTNSYHQQVISNALQIYRESGINKPLWIDEFGFKLETEQSQLIESYQNQKEYYQSYFLSTLCTNKNSLQNSIPGFLWVVGNDRYLADPSKDGPRTPFGLFAGFKQNQPITQSAWAIVQHYYRNTSCENTN